MTKPHHNVKEPKFKYTVEKIISDFTMSDIEDKLYDIEKLKIDGTFKRRIESYTRKNAVILANFINEYKNEIIDNFNFIKIPATSDGNVPMIVFTGENREEFDMEPILYHSFNAHFAWIKNGEDKIYHAHCFPEIYYCFSGSAVISIFDERERKLVDLTINKNEYEIIKPFIWHKCKQTNFIGFFGKFWDDTHYLKQKIEFPGNMKK